MSVTIDNVIKLLGDTQLKYRRLHFEDFTRELAPRPATMSNRIQLPSFFRSLFDDGANIAVQSVSGKKYSFWHSIMHCLYPNYIDLPWYDRKNLVDRFIDELNHDVQGYFQRDEIISGTNMNYENVRFHDNMPSDQLIYYICSKFKVNIIVCDTTRLYFYFAGITLDRNDPTLMLYRDDSPTFHVVTIDDRMLTIGVDPHDKLAMNNLHQTAPDVNRVLKEHITTRKIDTYAKINKLTPDETFQIKAKPTLNKMRVVELQALAQKYGLPIDKEGKTKKIKKLKKELIQDIMAYHTQNSL